MDSSGFRLRNINDLIPEDDLAQEMALARIAAEARGEDPERAAIEARDSFCRAARREAARVALGSSLRGGRVDLDWLPEASAVARSGASAPEAKKRGKVDPDRGYRDLAVMICYLAGMPTREIGRAFGLHQARICDSLRRMRARVGIARSRDMAVRIASSKSPKGRSIRVDGKRVWVGRYRPGDPPASSASYAK